MNHVQSVSLIVFLFHISEWNSVLRKACASLLSLCCLAKIFEIVRLHMLTNTFSSTKESWERSLLLTICLEGSHFFHQSTRASSNDFKDSPSSSLINKEILLLNRRTLHSEEFDYFCECGSSFSFFIWLK